MATARKLPSGKWRVRIYIKDHEPPYVSFTSEGVDRYDKTEVENEATNYKLNWERDHGKKAPANMTVGEAIDQYIDSKDAILSPPTIREYKRMRQGYLQSLMEVALRDLTQNDVQIAINEDARNHSPKTVRNIHGLLSAALAVFHPDLTLRTTLPPKRKQAVTIPDDEAVLRLLTMASKNLKKAILIGAYSGLRRSEICALTGRDLLQLKQKVHVSKAMLRQQSGGDWVIRERNKSTDSTRDASIPQFVFDEIGEVEPDERVVPMYPNSITSSFCLLRKKIGFKFRFHDLRHYHASIMLALGIPDKYAMEQMGHSTTSMLKSVYQHTINEKKEEFLARMEAYYQQVYDTKYDTEALNPLK